MAMTCRLFPFSLLFFLFFLGSCVHAFKTVYESGFSAKLKGSLDQDVEVLLELRALIDVESSVYGEWNLSQSPCGWLGVECEEIATTDGMIMEKRVVGLQLDSKQLKGIIPPEIGKLSELKKVSMANNMLIGRIPKYVAACLKLETLDLRGNRLSGPIPSELHNLRRLKVLHLADNTLSGQLSFLSKRSNPGGESGPFPYLECPFPYLEYLNLANNRITGMIPSDIARIQTLESIFLSGNLLVGSIPNSLGSLTSLEVLHLHNNFLHGKLPPSLAQNSSKLTSLDVSGNFLVGRIPPSYAMVKTLRLLNVSNNNLEGPIPWGAWFKYGVDSSAFYGNSRLCGRPLKTCPKTVGLELSSSFSSSSQRSREQNQLQRQQSQDFLSTPKNSRSTIPKARFLAEEVVPPPAQAPNASHPLAPAPAPKESQPQKKKKKYSAKKWALGMSIGILTGAVSAIVFSFVYRMLLYYIRGRPKVQGAVIYSSLIKKAEHLAFLETEDGLKSLELVGKGGSGEVYKAILPDGKEIAIKKIVQPSANPTDPSEEDSKLVNRKKRQIRAELETLGHIKHRNLVTLLAYIARPDCHLLIYEYMKNGSLQQALERVKEGTLELTWPMRHNIALGIASGLQYLHFHSTPKIIHRDLKPGNILLDDNFNAHVADFGLAKALPEAATHATSSNVAGTVGYIAPEYHQTLKFTDKCDVYSFGVVLAVLVTGKNPYDDFFQNIPQASIPKWLRNVVGSESAANAIDPQLKGSGYDDEIFLVMKVACFCTDDDAAKRPNSKEVLSMLNQISA